MSSTPLNMKSVAATIEHAAASFGDTLIDVDDVDQFDWDWIVECWQLFEGEADRPSFEIEGTSLLLRWPIEMEAGLIPPWVDSCFNRFRAGLDRPNVVLQDELNADLLDQLGRLTQERDDLIRKLAAALGDRDHAVRRADLLEAQLDAARAAQGEPDRVSKLTILKGIAAIVGTALTVGGGAWAGDRAADASEAGAAATVEVAQIDQRTELMKVAISGAGADGSTDDLDEWIDAALETVERLQACPFE